MTTRSAGDMVRSLNEAERIDGDVTLASLDLLPGVKTSRPSCFGGLDRLAIDDDCGRRSFTALGLTRGEYEEADDLLPQSSPSIKAVLDRREGEKSLGSSRQGHPTRIMPISPRSAGSTSPCWV